MRVVLIAALSLLLLSFQNTGAHTFGNETIESLETMGTVKLNGTTVVKRLAVTGNLIAHDSTIFDLESAGDTQLVNTVIDKARVLGSLRAVETSIHETLIFSGQIATFSKCELKGITVQREGGFKGRQVIELKERSFVDGPILFEGGGGEVHLYPGSKVLGAITGGKLIRKN